MWPWLQPHFLLSLQNDSVVSNFLIYCSWQVADLSLYEDKVLVTCLSFTFVPCLQLLPLQSLGRGDWSLFPQVGITNICPNSRLFVTCRKVLCSLNLSRHLFSVQYLNSDWAALLIYLLLSQKQGWGLCLQLLIPLIKSPLGSWVPAGLMYLFHIISWSWCFLYTVGVSWKSQVPQVKCLLTSTARLILGSWPWQHEGECVNDSTGWSSWDLVKKKRDKWVWRTAQVRFFKTEDKT